MVMKQAWFIGNNLCPFIAAVPYSGLFSLGANFPEFPKWAHDSGKFILGCCIMFECG